MTPDALNDPLMNPVTVDQLDDPRKKIAMALQLQRGMQKPTPMGNLANTALQAYNAFRTPPTPSMGMTPRGPAPDMAFDPTALGG